MRETENADRDTESERDGERSSTTCVCRKKMKSRRVIWRFCSLRLLLASATASLMLAAPAASQGEDMNVACTILAVCSPACVYIIM